MRLEMENPTHTRDIIGVLCEIQRGHIQMEQEFVNIWEYWLFDVYGVDGNLVRQTQKKCQVRETEAKFVLA